MLLNTTRKKALSVDVRMYRSDWAKALGLMFRVTPPTFTVLFPFTPARRVRIHMWFVFVPLDIVWLDAGGVVQACKTLRPWMSHAPPVLSRYVLELPVGTLKKTGTRRGDTMNIKEIL